MTGHPDDRDLVTRFAQLRREQHDAASPFAVAVASHGARRRDRLAIAASVMAAVALIAAGVLAIRHERRLPRPADMPAVLKPPSARWTSPTDFLLDIPGNWLLRDLPRVAAPASLHFDIVTFRRVSS